jgi:hypothetical protein
LGVTSQRLNFTKKSLKRSYLPVEGSLDQIHL